MMLSFLPFKSKQFIFLISLYSNKSKRHLSLSQTKVIRKNNYIEYTIHERTHREVLPAIIWSNGNQFWYKNGKCHRNDRDENGKTLPAIIWSNGTQQWFRNGQCHRDDLDENGRLLPAAIYSIGTRMGKI